MTVDFFCLQFLTSSLNFIRFYFNSDAHTQENSTFIMPPSVITPSSALPQAQVKTQVKELTSITKGQFSKGNEKKASISSTRTNNKPRIVGSSSSSSNKVMVNQTSSSTKSSSRLGRSKVASKTTKHRQKALTRKEESAISEKPSDNSNLDSIIGDTDNTNDSSLLATNSFNSGLSGGPHNMMGMNYMGGLGMGYGMGYMGGMGGMGGMPMLPGYMSNITNFLFGFQQVVFSIGQAVQIVSMNTNALQHFVNSGIHMSQSAKQTFEEFQQKYFDFTQILTLTQDSVKVKHGVLIEGKGSDDDSIEMKKKKRRLKAIRWSMLLLVSYTCYRIVRRFIRNRVKRKAAEMVALGYGYRSNNRHQLNGRNNGNHNMNMSNSLYQPNPYRQEQYHNGNYYNSNPYNRNYGYDYSSTNQYGQQYHHQAQGNSYGNGFENSNLYL